MSKPRQAPAVADARDLIPPLRAAAILGVSTDTLRKWCGRPEHKGLASASIRLPSGHYRYVETRVRAYAKRISVSS